MGEGVQVTWFHFTVAVIEIYSDSFIPMVSDMGHFFFKTKWLSYQIYNL